LRSDAPRPDAHRWRQGGQQDWRDAFVMYMTAETTSELREARLLFKRKLAAFLGR
jgi:hypothetical protein